jgi:Gas vesicle synthesis protein GvpL/GvpF
MKDDIRKKLSELIIEELAERIKQNNNLRRKLEPFTDLPVGKVADAIIKQFEYLLSSDLRDLILYLIEQEVKAERAATENISSTSLQDVKPEEEKEAKEEKVQEISVRSVETAPVETKSAERVMEKFATKEPFQYTDIDFELKPDDWFYLYGFCYAPDSTGKGVPSKQLLIKGVDGKNNIFLLDYGDVRLFLQRLSGENNPSYLSERPPSSTEDLFVLKYGHENILNTLRADEWIVPLSFWNVIQSKEQIIKRVEDRYVEMLRTLIDIHDAVEWDVEAFAYDEYLIQHPSIAAQSQDRIKERTSRQPKTRGKDIKVLERLMIREKNIAQEIHSQLLLHSSKTKIDFMVRLDNAYMDDWKSILSVRYTVGKEKRKNFCQTIRSLQNEYAEFKLMLKVSNPNTKFSFT